MGRNEDELMHNLVVGRYPEMRRAAYLMCGDWQLAETLVRATLAKIVAGRRRRAHDLDPLARRELMHAFRAGWRGPFRRREHLFHSIADTHDAPPRRPGGLDPLVKVSVLAALHQLPPRRRAVVVLHHWELLSLEETARTLKMSLRAAQAHSDAGLAALHAVAGDLLRDSADPGGIRAASIDPASAHHLLFRSAPAGPKPTHLASPGLGSPELAATGSGPADTGPADTFSGPADTVTGPTGTLATGRRR